GADHHGFTALSGGMEWHLLQCRSARIRCRLADRARRGRLHLCAASQSRRLFLDSPDAAIRADAMLDEPDRLARSTQECIGCEHCSGIEFRSRIRSVTRRPRERAPMHRMCVKGVTNSTGALTTNIGFWKLPLLGG